MKKEGLDVISTATPTRCITRYRPRRTRGDWGSFNFSSNADQDNDENLLIVEDAAYARAFRAEFDRVLAVAKQAPQP